jgi:hypothetical protein
MPALKIGAAMLAATLVLSPAAAFAGQGGTPNSHAKTNTHAHPNNDDPQPSKGNDWGGGMTCGRCAAEPAEPTSPVSLVR